MFLIKSLTAKYITGERYAPIELDKEQGDTATSRAMLYRLNKAFKAAYDGQSFKAEELLNDFVSLFKTYTQEQKEKKRWK